MNELINGLYNKIDNQEKIIRELQSQNIELKKQVDFQLIKISFLIERIDKAIDFIMQPNIEIREYHSCDMDYVYVSNELLEILRGKDK